MSQPTNADVDQNTISGRGPVEAIGNAETVGVDQADSAPGINLSGGAEGVPGESNGSMSKTRDIVSAAASSPHKVRGLLTVDERKELDICMRTIDAGVETFVQVGIALLTVRERRLYRETHERFEDWCQENYGWTARRARQLCDAAETVENLKVPTEGNYGPFVLPATETQARPLSVLAPEEQRAAWREAVETAPNGRVTEKHVKKVVNARRPSSEPQMGTKVPISTPTPAAPILEQPAGTREERWHREATDIVIKMIGFEAQPGMSSSAVTQHLVLAREHMEAVLGQLRTSAQMQAARSAL